MTVEERNKMFAKDYLSIKDIQVLLKLKYQAAAALIRQIRRKCDRLNIQGKIHVQDYIDYFKLDISRYCAGAKGEEYVHTDS